MPLTYGNTARRVIADLESIGLPATPAHYETWFHHLERNSPELSKKISDRMNGNGSITPWFLTKLHQTYISDAESPDTSVLDVVESISAQTTSLQSINRDMISTNAKASKEARKTYEALSSDDLEINEIQASVATLLANGARALRQNKVLESRLDEASTQIAELQMTLQRLENQACKDFLTNLHNRRYFEDFLNKEISNCLENSEPLSLIICDIDHFKRFNDKHGHVVGDQVLVHVAKVLRDNTKGVDCVARIGGEEFVIVLPNTVLENAQVIAESLRKKIAAQTLASRTSGTTLGNITMSFGVAHYSRQLGDLDSFVELADKYLYEAKASGRNKVVSQN